MLFVVESGKDDVSAGLSGETFRIAPNRVADAIAIENLNVRGLGTLTLSLTKK